MPTKKILQNGKIYTTPDERKHPNEGALVLTSEHFQWIPMNNYNRRVAVIIRQR